MSKKARKNRATARAQAAHMEQDALALVQRLDERILAATDAALNEGERAEVLAWAHRDLMVPTMLEGLLRDDPETLEKVREQWAKMCEVGAHTVGLMLEGAMKIKPGLEFEFCGPKEYQWLGKFKANGENSIAPDSKRRAQELVEWYHQRLVERAQESRPHGEEEIRALLAWADALVITGTLVDFNIRWGLGINLSEPMRAFTDSTMVNLAVEGFLHIEWTGKEAVFSYRKPMQEDSSVVTSR